MMGGTFHLLTSGFESNCYRHWFPIRIEIKVFCYVEREARWKTCWESLDMDINLGMGEFRVR